MKDFLVELAYSLDNAGVGTQYYRRQVRAEHPADAIIKATSTIAVQPSAILSAHVIGWVG